VARDLEIYEACSRRAGKYSLRPASGALATFRESLATLKETLPASQQAESVYLWSQVLLEEERRPQFVAGIDEGRAAGVALPEDLLDGADDPRLLVAAHHFLEALPRPLPQAAQEQALVTLTQRRDALQADWLITLDLTDDYEAAGPMLALAGHETDAAMTAFGQELTKISPALYRNVMGFTLAEGAVQVVVLLWGLLVAGAGRILGAWRKQDRYTGLRRVAMVAVPVAAATVAAVAGWKITHAGTGGGAGFLLP
jgi:hypothetical protein